MLYHTIILGGGAAGLMAAAHLKDKDILIIDANPTLGKKIAISGGGRCNITNEFVSAHNYLADKKFIAPVLERFDQTKVMDYFHARGLQTVKEKNNQYFCRHSAQDLIDILLEESRKAHIHRGEQILGLEFEGHFKVTTDRGNYRTQNVLIATGGPCLPKIGASDIGVKLASFFGHTSREFEPVLVGLSLQKEQFWMKELSGISFKAAITVGKKSFTDQLLFAHKGISGPAVLSASLYWRRASVIIDFLPDYKLKNLLKDRKKALSSQIPLPKRFVKAFLESLDIEDKAAGAMTPQERERLSLIKSYHFAPAGNFGLARAEATRGGILTDAIDHETMESRLQKGLFFAGEVLDVTGELGGYNFQWAFSSGYTAARELAQR